MKNLKLNVLASQKLSKLEMNQMKGGAKSCTCGCQGPSSTADNGSANMDTGKKSQEKTYTKFCELNPVVITA
jgi:natural product precursor